MRQQGWKLMAVTIVLAGSLFVWKIAGAQNPAPPAGTKTAVREAVPAKAPVSAAKEATPMKKTVKKPAGRLPVFYADIVTEEQRAKIYSIQASYADKLSALTEQIKAIQAQQSAEIEAVLTEEQKVKLNAAKEEAAAKRKQRAESATASEAPKKSAE